MQPYSDEFSARELAPQRNEITVGGHAYRARTGRGEGVVVERGGLPWTGKEYRISRVLGGRSVYYFFTQAEKGRLKALPLAYDIGKRTWVERTAAGVRHAEREVQGSGDDLVLTSACYGCHVDLLASNYDLKKDTYGGIPPEQGIQCGACHGPLAEHVDAVRNAPGVGAKKDLRIFSPSRETANPYSEPCAPCHARMTPITATYEPGDRFFDHFDVVTLEGPDGYPDGRGPGEVSTYTSWLMNPCARSGRLSCIHCHTPGGGYRFRESSRANDACMPCHEKTVGNPGMHTHHPPLTPGSMCISCHMPSTGNGIAHRTDHSMLPPTPATSMLYRSPNACTICHKDRGDQWADRWARKWYGEDYQVPVLRRAALVDAARRKEWNELDGMLAYLQSGDRDEVYAASLIRLLKTCPDPTKTRVLRTMLLDQSPLVRSAAAESLGDVQTPDVINDLIRAAADPARIVRIRSAAALTNNAMVAQPGEEAKILSRATGEYLGSLMVRQDSWESHVSMGNYFLAQGDAKNAIVALMAAKKLNPRAVPPYVSASIAQAKLGNFSAAEAELAEALRLDPANAPALFNLGLLKNDQGRPQEAIRYLKEAFRSDPALAAAAFNLSVILSASDMKEARTWARKAYELHPDMKYGYTLAYITKQDGDWNESMEILRQLIVRYPLNPDAYLLLGEILEKRGKAMEAEAVYRQGMSVEGMTGHDKARIEKRLKKLQ